MSRSPTHELVREFASSLEAEVCVYRSLLRLAHRQEGYFVKGDARRLEKVASAITGKVEEARDISSTRERDHRDLAAHFGVAPDQLSLKSLGEVADEELTERIEAALSDLAATGDKLYRKNHQNHMLARFSLDLLQEEMELVLDAPGEGEAYGETAERPDSVRRGMVNGRA